MTDPALVGYEASCRLRLSEPPPARQTQEAGAEEESGAREGHGSYRRRICKPLRIGGCYSEPSVCGRPIE